MSNSERSGWRDQAYSTWHRTLGDDFDFLDVDWIERCHECKRILAIYELCADMNREDKPAFVTRQLATSVGVPAYVVLYHAENGHLSRIKVRRIAPEPASEWREVAPTVWARHLANLRTCHPVAPPTVTQAPSLEGSWRSSTCGAVDPDGGRCGLAANHDSPHRSPDWTWPKVAA